MWSAISVLSPSWSSGCTRSHHSYGYSPISSSAKPSIPFQRLEKWISFVFRSQSQRPSLTTREAMS